MLIGLKVPQAGVQLQENVLRQFFGGGVVAKEMPGNAEDHRLIAADEIRKIAHRDGGCTVRSRYRCYSQGSRCLTYLYAWGQAGECKIFVFRQEFLDFRSLLLRLQAGRLPWEPGSPFLHPRRS